MSFRTEAPRHVLDLVCRSAPLSLETAGLETYLLANGERQRLSAAEKRELIERSRAGEQIELEIEAITYIQREEPNRNFIRFKQGALRSIAKSGKDTPFLRDHSQNRQENRGGTIIKSKAEKNEAGETLFRQTIRVTVPWAVQGVLDGTIDRFSIGWLPTGPLVYSHNGKEIQGFPRHWPGDEVELEDGTVVTVEWVFTAAELIETSGVNVPAVVGTRITDQIQAALAAHRDGDPPSRKQQPKEEKETSMHRLLLALGLSADAAEESALAAVEKLEQDKKAAADRADTAELELKAEREAHDATKEKLAAHEQREAAEAEAKLDSAIEQLYQEGKLARGRSADGKKAEADPYEATLREVATKLGWEKFEAAAARLSQKVPVGTEQSKQPAPVELSGNGVIPIDEGRRRRMRSLGLREESYQHAPGRFDLSQVPPRKAEKEG